MYVTLKDLVGNGVEEVQCAVLNSLLGYQITNMKKQFDIFFLAVGLVSRDVLPYVPTTGESKECKRMTNARKKRQDKTVPP